MNPCDKCTIDDKVYSCCGRYPETGETVRLNLDNGQKIYACPYLNSSGRCTIYERRPIGCREYYCSLYILNKKIGWEYLNFLTEWNISSKE